MLVEPYIPHEPRAVPAPAPNRKSSRSCKESEPRLRIGPAPAHCGSGSGPPRGSEPRVRLRVSRGSIRVQPYVGVANDDDTAAHEMPYGVHVTECLGDVDARRMMVGVDTAEANDEVV